MSVPVCQLLPKFSSPRMQKLPPFFCGRKEENAHKSSNVFGNEYRLKAYLSSTKLARGQLKTKTTFTFALFFCTMIIITLKNSLVIHEQNSKEIHFLSMSVYYDTEFC